MIDVDEALLIRLAGVRAFGQGMHCFEEGRVSKLAMNDKLTRAVVLDGDKHEVRLRHTHSMIGRIELDGEPWDVKEVRTFFETFESFLLRINEYIDQLDPIVLLRAVV